MANYILDKAYEVTDTGGVSAYRVVVQGTNAGQCALPGAANADKILGATVHAQTLQGQNVAVRKAGIARVMAAGAITLGAAVNIAGTSGKVKAVNESSGTKVFIVGFAETAASADGDIIEVFLSFHQRTV